VLELRTTYKNITKIQLPKYRRRIKLSKMRVYNLKDFFCEICSLQFDKKAVYDIHMSFVHKIGIKVKEESKDLGQDNNSENNQNSYNLNYPIKKDLETPISCSICQANFSTKGNLKTHIDDVHNEKKPHKCSKCDCSYSQKSNLKRHIADVHEGNKPHKCLICDYSCSRKGSALKATY